MSDTLWTDASKIWVGFIQEDSPLGLYRDIRQGFLIWKMKSEDHNYLLYFPTEDMNFFTADRLSNSDEIYASYIGPVRLQLGSDVTIVTERTPSGAINAVNGNLSIRCRSEQRIGRGVRLVVGTYTSDCADQHQAVFSRWRLILDDNRDEDVVLIEYPAFDQTATG